MSLFRLTVWVATIVLLACNSVDAPPSAPANACPDNPCRAYLQPGSTPVCTAGACLVTASVPGLALVVTLPTASAFGPGSTFAVGYDHLFDNPLPANFDAGPGTIAALPSFGAVQGAYLVTTKATVSIGFPLGNDPKLKLPTELPAEATYRMLWPQSDGTFVPAQVLDLPIEPVQGILIDAPGNLSNHGPAGGRSVAFQAFMQPGRYELVLTPSPPFDRVFGPRVAVVSVGSGLTTDPETIDDFDVTRETNQGATIPAFDIWRMAGLDGWKAYLRDAGSRLTLSNVAPLGGTMTHVVLATSQVPPMGDALTGAALVIEPPAGQPYPTGVFQPIGNVLPAAETYPTLPAPAMVRGQIEAEDGTPVAADILFEALAITDANGLLNTSNFEFVAQVHARPGPPLGASTYSIELPQGNYRVSVHPLDQVSQQTTLPFAIGADPGPRDVVVAPLRTVVGTAAIADGRPLFGATVEATGVACSEGPSPFCLPRQATTLTASDGSFQLTLDPGQYLLRVRPADGTRLPWVVQPLALGAGREFAHVVLPAISVPAPVSAGLTLVDPTGNPVARAVVRVFSIPTLATAIEVGRSLTQDDGRFEMYIQPPAR